VEPIAKPFFPNLFFHLFDTAKFEPRGTLRIPGPHACSNVFLDPHFGVEMNLLVEICVHATSYEEISQETSDFDKERHAAHLATKLPGPV